ncbi:MFS-type transporter slc18b1-like protein [Plakobranchus ocellatus]|uniref:MFS-type transporter slc18b1-like protein n=1 Tax=Plakobranchus ocellatus TaxID=259542 RepID=A0AAV3ZKL9_9GAST|nr:MFS-type transporter slc18b1-like protein [Plakobranchus ocellatus]
MVISGFRPLLGHGAGGGARTRDGRAHIKGMSTAVIGLVFSSYLIVCFLGSLAFGQFIFEVFILCARFLNIVPEGSVFTSLSFLFRVLSAVGQSAFTACNFAIISSLFEDYVSQVFALLETSIGIGLMMGPTLGGGLYQAGGFGLPFWVIGAVMACSSIIFFFCLPPVKGRSRFEVAL